MGKYLRIPEFMEEKNITPKAKTWLRVIDRLCVGMAISILKVGVSVTIKKQAFCPEESSASYILNRQTRLIIACSTKLYSGGRHGSKRWVFLFGQKTMGFIRLGTKLSGFLTLACFPNQWGGLNVPLCLVEAEKIVRLLDMTADEEQITVEYPVNRRRYRLVGNKQQSLLIFSRNIANLC